MKKQLQWTFLAIAALTLSGAPAFAQSNTVTSSASDRSLGNVERADKLIGAEVRNNSGQKLGKIEDVAVDLESGRVLYAVISAGGFLGIGDRLIAVPPGAFTSQGHQLRLDADKQKLGSAAQFSKADDQAAEMLSPSFAANASKPFGQSTWFSASTPSFNNAHLVSKLSGMDVRNISNAKIGDVENALIDLPAGRVAFVVFTPDGSMDLKHKRYALPPNALTLAADKESLVTGIDRETWSSAPGFDNDWPDFSNQSLASRIYQHYGKQAYFDNGSSLKATSTSTNSPERIYHDADKSKQ